MAVDTLNHHIGGTAAKLDNATFVDVIHQCTTFGASGQT